MADKAWKAAERRVARRFREAGYPEALRVPLSGSNSGHGTGADLRNVPELYVEVKYGKQVGAVAVDLYRLGESAKRQGRQPLIHFTLEAEPDGLSWSALYLDDWAKLGTWKHEPAKLPLRAAGKRWLLAHRAGMKLPHADLVCATVAAAAREAKKPLVVLVPFRRPREIVLVPEVAA